MQEGKPKRSFGARKLWLSLIAAFLFNSALAQESNAPDFQLELQLEDRLFINDGLYPGQEQNFISIAATPQLEWEWRGGDEGLKITLFGRWDQHDDNRTHFDIREFYYQRVFNNAELSVGLKKVYWGVTESVHLVDIINQTDQVETFDGEQKLGQPMVHYSYLANFGTLDFFYLPYARKRQFPSEEGRLRFPIAIERDDINIDSKNDEWRPSLAARWKHYIGAVDLGVSYFHGVGREPLFLDITSENPDLIYPIIDQVGLEFQAITGPMLWKVESIYRYAQEQDFTALVAGFEYTFGNIASSGIDLGILGEYLYDSRDDLAISSLASDVFTGFRLAFNDTQSSEILAGAIFDLDRSSQIFSLEASRRIGDSWKTEIEGRFFENISENEFFYFTRNDSFLRFSVSKYF